MTSSHIDRVNSDEAETLILGSILGSAVSVSVPENHIASKNIRLVFKSGNFDLIFKLKRELLQEKCEHLSNSGKGPVLVPYELVRKVEDLRSFMESVFPKFSVEDQATEENVATLEVCYNFLRQEISSELP